MSTPRLPRPTRVPDPLYKFTEVRYARLMVNLGVFRIGTLHDFRKAEAHARFIGDPEEGKKLIEDELTGPRLLTDDPKTHTRVTRTLFKIEKGGSLRLEDSVGGGVLAVQIDEPDCFVYCFTENRDPAAWTDYPNYDACVEIREPPRFIYTLSLAAQLGPDFKMGKCVYHSRVEPAEEADADPAVLIKPPAFEHQREWRALWPDAPRGEILTPLPPVWAPEARHFCRIVWTRGP